MKSTGLGKLIVGVVVHAYPVDGRAARPHNSTSDCCTATHTSTAGNVTGLDGLALVDPLREHVDGLVQMMDGHLEAGATEAAGQRADALLLVHLAFDDVVDGTKRTFEALGQRGPLLGLDLQQRLIWNVMGVCGAISRRVSVES